MRMKFKLPILADEVYHDLVPFCDSYLIYTTLPFTHYTPAMLAFVLFFAYGKLFWLQEFCTKSSLYLECSSL